MTPQSFEFTLSLPGDPRFVGAIRDLTRHAAGYAQLSAEATESLVAQVAAAADAASAEGSATAASGPPVAIRFAAAAAVLTVTITYVARDGSRQTREVRQRLTS